MSKTLSRHILIKNIFDIFLDFFIFIHFHYISEAIPLKWLHFHLKKGWPYNKGITEQSNKLIFLFKYRMKKNLKNMENINKKSSNH